MPSLSSFALALRTRSDCLLAYSGLRFPSSTYFMATSTSCGSFCAKTMQLYAVWRPAPMLLAGCHVLSFRWVTQDAAGSPPRFKRSCASTLELEQAGVSHAPPTAATVHSRDRRAEGAPCRRCLEHSRSRPRRPRLYRRQRLAQPRRVHSRPRGDRGVSHAQMESRARLSAD